MSNPTWQASIGNRRPRGRGSQDSGHSSTSSQRSSSAHREGSSRPPRKRPQPNHHKSSKNAHHVGQRSTGPRPTTPVRPSTAAEGLRSPSYAALSPEPFLPVFYSRADLVQSPCTEQPQGRHSTQNLPTSTTIQHGRKVSEGPSTRTNFSRPSATKGERPLTKHDIGPPLFAPVQPPEYSDTAFESCREPPSTPPRDVAGTEICVSPFPHEISVMEWDDEGESAFYRIKQNFKLRTKRTANTSYDKITPITVKSPERLDNATPRVPSKYMGDLRNLQSVSKRSSPVLSVDLHSPRSESFVDTRRDLTYDNLDMRGEVYPHTTGHTPVVANFSRLPVSFGERLDAGDRAASFDQLRSCGAEPVRSSAALLPPVPIRQTLSNGGGPMDRSAGLKSFMKSLVERASKSNGKADCRRVPSRSASPFVVRARC